MSGQGSTGNVIAALCNFFIPGLGYLIQGRFMAAVLIFVFVGVCYFMAVLIIPAILGGLAHLYCIYDAATYKSVPISA